MNRVLWLLAAFVACGQCKLVKEIFVVDDWVVDYLRPTVDAGGEATRKAPFHVPYGVKKEAQLVNGVYPGPTLRATEGDDVEVTVVNNMLSDATSIHWHGLHQLGTPYYDGAYMVAQAGIPPGTNFTYKFKAFPPGTHFWHAHMDALQIDKGIRGPIVFEAVNDPFKNDYDKELVVVLADEWQQPRVCLKDEGALPGNPVCAEIDKASFNGQWGNGSLRYPFPVIEVEEGRCYRMRFVNMAGQADNFVIDIDGHNQTVIALDSYDIKPLKVGKFNIHQGERMDVIICADQPEGYYLINATYDLACPLRRGHINPPDMPHVDACSFYAFIKYSTATKVPHHPKGTGGGANPAKKIDKYFNLDVRDGYDMVEPYKPAPMPEEPDMRIFMNLGVAGDTHYSPEKSPLSTNRWYMNDGTESWRNPLTPVLQTKGTCGSGNTPIITVPENVTNLEVVIQNLSPTPHVLHLHGGYFQVINYANFSWCSLEKEDCYYTPWAIQKWCPKENLHISDPKDPLLGAGMYWGCGFNQTTDKPKQNLATPIKKDMVGVWRRSWAVIRLSRDSVLSNPGYWLFHCHVEPHIPLGMMTAFNVLNSKQPPIPKDVPTSGPCPVVNPAK